MFGITELWGFAVFVCAFVAAATDLARGKIYNWMTFPFAIFGMALAFWTTGATGLLSSVTGAAVGFALFGWMFFFGWMGAGDVKLLMAFGALGGALFALDVAILSVLVGGAISLVLMAFKGRLGAFFFKLKRLLLSLAIKELEVDLPKLDRTMTIPFGVPMAIAAVWTVVDAPLARWGFKWW